MPARAEISPTIEAVYAALQEGVPLNEYARQSGLSPTAYTHLRRIKEKTRTKRQAELVHKLSGVQLPGRGE